jgi:hypothetical protein
MLVILLLAGPGPAGAWTRHAPLVTLGPRAGSLDPGDPNWLADLEAFAAAYAGATGGLFGYFGADIQ